MTLPGAPATARVLLHEIGNPSISGQGPRVSVGCGFCAFSLGFWPGFLPPWAYFRVCVSVAVFLSTETSLHNGGHDHKMHISDRGPVPGLLEG